MATGYNDISGRNRYSGLISGLDTEQLVKAMTMNTKNRINTQKQKLQTLTWKQESYRDVISKISDFKNKYLDILSDTSIKANKVMKSYKTEVSNDKVISATAAAGSTPAKYTIKQAHAAKAATVSSNGSISTGEVKLDFSNAVSGRTYNVEMTLDGVTKNVAFKGGADAEASKKNFLNATNAVFAEVKGSDKQFEFTAGTSDLKFNSGDDVFHTFSVGYNQEGVGLGNTTSNKIYTGTSISSVGFKQALQETSDGKYAFNINGVDIEVGKDDTISSIISKVNNSDAGVKLSFSNVSQSFTLESKTTGDAAEINVYQTKGNLLNAMFNIESGSLNPTTADTAKLTYIDNVKTSGRVSKAFTDALSNGTSDNLTHDVKVTDNDGNTYSFKVDLGAKLKDMPKDGEGAYIDEVVSAAYNKAFKDAYKAATGNELADDNFELSYAGGQLTIDSPDLTVEMKGGFIGDANMLTNGKEMNASPAYIPVSGANTMTFDRNGEIVTVTGKDGADISMQDLIEAKIITLPSDGNVIAAGTITGTDQAAKDFLTAVFGKDKVEGAKDGDVMTARGSNSMLEVSSDGVTFTKYSSATNLFTFDGTTINLTEAKDFVAETEEDYITVETKKDNSAIKDVIVGFVNDYNKLLEDLYKVIETKRPRSSGSYYDPLTEEQEEEMSDKEIEKWNNNAKEGLLYRDSNVQRFLSEIRSAMLTRVDGFGLQDMGITLTDSWKDNGKLKIDESKLESAIEAYGDQVANMFTGTDGLAAKLESVVDKAISTSKSNNPNNKKTYGYLSALAGIEGTKTDKDNYIYKQMETINKVIERLTTKYENEQERYWKQYTRLETLMAQMQTTMSYFEQY